MLNVSYTIIENNTLTPSVASNGQGIAFYGSSYNNITGNDLSSNGYGMKIWYYSSNNIIKNNIASYGNDVGIYLYSSDNNTLQNNDASHNLDYDSSGIEIQSSNNNILISNTANDNMNFNLELVGANNTNVSNSDFSITSGTEVYVHGINNIFLNCSYSDGETVTAGSQLIRKWYYRAYVNDTSNNNMSGVNITAYNTTGSNQFNLTTDSTGYTGLGEIIDYVNNGGAITYYSNYSIYAGNTSWPYLNHTFNVTNQGDTSQHNNYKDLFTFSQTSISLVSGWNLIGLTMHSTDTGTDRNISLPQNWSLIGYSSDVVKNLSDINFINSSNNSTNWSTSVSQGKAQAYLIYRESNVNKYVATPDLSMQDYALRQNKGYWIKINQLGGGNFSMPGVGGSLSGQTYDWSKLRFSNGTEERNITQAGDVWIQNKLYFYNTTSLDWDLICDDITCQKNTSSSWEGVFILSNQNNINLIRRN